MPRILEQYEIHCSTCGEYMWKYLNSAYNLDFGSEEELKRDDFCGKCDPKKYIECLKSAEKIMPLTKNQRDDV